MAKTHLTQPVQPNDLDANTNSPGKSLLGDKAEEYIRETANLVELPGDDDDDLEDDDDESLDLDEEVEIDLDEETEEVDIVEEDLDEDLEEDDDDEFDEEYEDI